MRELLGATGAHSSTGSDRTAPFRYSIRRRMRRMEPARISNAKAGRSEERHDVRETETEIDIESKTRTEERSLYTLRGGSGCRGSRSGGGERLLSPPRRRAPGDHGGHAAADRRNDQRRARPVPGGQR